MLMRKRAIAIVTAALAVGLALTPLAANATSSSGTARFDNGKTLTANAWIQPFTWTGCGSFQTSALMNAKPNYITNATSFYQVGLGSIAVKGLSITSSRQGPATLVWTNSNGSLGSYLSGSVCGGWGAVYVGVDVTAKASYNGNLRIASAHI
jgi:hypothetical protein